MLESLRARLLLWYTSVLALTIVLFGGAVCSLFWRSLVNGLDRALIVRAQGVAAALRPAPSSTFDLDLPEDYLREFGQGAQPARYYVIWNARGEMVDRSDPDREVPRPVPPAARIRAGVREVAVLTPGGATILVGEDTADLSRRVWSLAGTVAGVGLGALALSLLGSWFLAGQALAPIARISRTAKAMSEGNLSARIAIDRTETELGQVGLSLNAAFDRLHQALERQRRFTADASHELRTPLAVLSAELEWASVRPRSVAEYQASLETCARAATRMQALVEGLLTLARADAGDVAVRRERVCLRDLVLDVVGWLEPIANKRGVRLAVADGDPVEVSVDPDRLREAVTNLASNAVSYNREGGRVDFAVWVEDGAGYLEVSDTGIGIPPEDLPRVFERFYRADKARGRESGGVGLGMAVAKCIVDGHGGEITCASDPARGTRFTVRLPRPLGRETPTVG